MYLNRVSLVGIAEESTGSLLKLVTTIPVSNF